MKSLGIGKRIGWMVPALGVILAACRREPAPLRPGDPVAARLNFAAVAGIEIRRGESGVRLSRGPDGWVSDSLYGYAVRIEPVRDSLQYLQDLKIGQVLSVPDSMLPELGLADWPLDVGPLLDRPDSVVTNGPKTVALSDSAGRELFRIQFGAPREFSGRGARTALPTGQYIRVGDGALYLTDHFAAEFSENAMDWVESRLCDLRRFDVEWVEIEQKGKSVRTELGPDGDVVAEKSPVSPFAVRGILVTAEYMSAAGIADPALTDTVTGMDAPDRVSIQCRDGRRCDIFLGGATPDGRMVYTRIRLTDNKASSSGLPDSKRMEWERTARRHASALYLIPAATAAAFRPPLS